MNAHACTVVSLQLRHAVVAFDEDGDRVVLPFFLKGVASVLETESVTLEEFDRYECPRIELTAADLDWDPSSTVFEDQENITLNYKGDLVRPSVPKRAPLMLINSFITSTRAEAVGIIDGDNFAEALEANVNVSYLRLSKPRVATTVARGPALGNIHSEKGKQVDAATLASRWGIDHKKALNTVRMTTQRGVKSCLYIPLLDTKISKK